MTNILYINGPNLNLLGTRQPEVYGSTTLAEVEEMVRDHAKTIGVNVDFKQSNYEGQIVDWIQEAKGVADVLVLNAGAYTHTSIAIHDAIASVELPTIELHLSDIKSRESFRHLSYVEYVAFKSIMGHGPQGYIIALDAAVEYLQA